MGYYGLPKAKIAESLTPFQKALRSLPMEQWQKTLDVIETLFKNVAQNPKEAKFKIIKLENKKIAACITSVEAALEVFLLNEWVMSVDEESGAPVLKLPEGVKYTFPEHVNPVIDAKDFYKKEEEKVRVSQGLGRVAPGPPSEFKSMFADKDVRSPEDIELQVKSNIEKYRNVVVN